MESALHLDISHYMIIKLQLREIRHRGKNWGKHIDLPGRGKYNRIYKWTGAGVERNKNRSIRWEGEIALKEGMSGETARLEEHLRSRIKTYYSRNFL